MRFWVGLTDRDWYDYLLAQPHVEEVDFWQPSARKPVDFSVGEPFLFKLHKRHSGWVVVGGCWAHFTVLPARYAWDVFGTMNGAATFDEMARRMGRYRHGFDVHSHEIGCVALVQPVLLKPGEWIEPPEDWKPQIQVDRTYDTTDAIGASVWARFEAAGLRHVVAREAVDIAADVDRSAHRHWLHLVLARAPSGRASSMPTSAGVPSRASERCPCWRLHTSSPTACRDRMRPTTGYCCALTCTRCSTAVT